MIDTSRLLLRVPEERDAATYLRIHSDPDVSRWLGGSFPESVDEERDRIVRNAGLQAEHGFTMWAVEEKETGEVVGVTGLYHIEGVGPEVEVAYHFAKDRWGRGYATEAAQASIAYGFDVAGLDRIVGLVAPDNLASARVLEKCGLKQVGTAHHYDQDLNKYAIERA